MILAPGELFVSAAFAWLLTAALSLLAALYHVLNHACFKSLMFCCAGALQRATGSTRLDDMGGLIKRMPITAVLSLAGTLAITSMPPFNGFVSEWLLYHALLEGLFTHTLYLVLLLPLAGAALALSGGLAVVAFVKAFAVAFLARPRTEGAATASEASIAERAGIGLLAIACLALGLLPAQVIPIIGNVTQALCGHSVPAASAFWLAPATHVQATLSMPTLLAMLALLMGVAAVLPRLIGGRTSTRVAPTWACGLPQAPSAQYSPQGYSQPLRLIFGQLLLPHARETQVDLTVPPYFKREMRYTVFMESVVDKYLYTPVTHAVLKCSRVIGHTIQSGSIHLYLAYIFFALVAALLGVKWLG